MKYIAAWLIAFWPLPAMAQGWEIRKREIDLEVDPEISEGINNMLKNGAVRYLIYVAVVLTVYYGGRFLWRRLFGKKTKTN